MIKSKVGLTTLALAVAKHREMGQQTYCKPAAGEIYVGLTASTSARLRGIMA